MANEADYYDDIDHDDGFGATNPHACMASQPGHHIMAGYSTWTAVHMGQRPDCVGRACMTNLL
jgi:hypothetical protein|uniref:Uncharacterized protein n=1 Tax=Oryza sativa subsp. japonica TaxID=39947 RepID=Q8LIJ4_ORYSJ|nr:hypothetical protein [Oryza sativa Japonica Group]